MFVRSFDDATPPARFDGIPFTLAKIQESATSSGPWALIETITLSPVDPNPASPLPRDLTTANATLEQAYYRIVWEDAAGAQYVASPIFYADPAVDTPYFTVAEARAFDGGALSSETKYPTANIEAAREEVEQELEQRCGVAFVPRTESQVIDGNGGTDLLLRWPRPLTVTSASLDGSALTRSDLVLYRDGRVRYAARWTSGSNNVAITYTHGYAAVFPPAKRAALTWVKSLLVASPMDDRATRVTTEEMTYDLTPLPPRVTEFITTYSLNVAVA